MSVAVVLAVSDWQGRDGMDGRTRKWSRGVTSDGAEWAGIILAGDAVGGGPASIPGGKAASGSGTFGRGGSDLTVGVAPFYRPWLEGVSSTNGGEW